MEFNISSSELLRGTLAASKTIPAKSPSSPILTNFLFVLKDNVLEITASDTEVTLKTQVEVENTVEEGAIAVPAMRMVDLLKALPDQPLNIKTTGEASFVCKWATGESTLPYFPAEDYPAIAGTDETALTINFEAEELINAISSTVYATADEESRPMMNGILFDIDEQYTTLVASDSHKLVCYTLKDVKSEVKASFILHKRPAAVLRSIIDKEAENVEVTFDANNVVFKFGNTMAVCRLIKGKYPKYREVIPQNNSNVLNIERTVLLNAVRRVSVCANKASNHIKLELRPGELNISAQDLGFSLSAHEKIDCQYDGDEMSIGFKYTFLIDILSNLSCDNIVVKFADGRRAALIIPAEGEEERDKVCGILMPIMV